MKYILLFLLAIVVIAEANNNVANICRYVCLQNRCEKVCANKENVDICTRSKSGKIVCKQPPRNELNDIEEENKFKIKGIIKGIKKVVHIVDKVTKATCKLPIPSLAVQKACAIRHAIKNDVNDINEIDDDLDQEFNDENRWKIGGKLKKMVKKTGKILDKVLHPACKVPLHPTLTKICAMRDAIKNDEDINDSNIDDDNDLENKLKFVEKLKEIAQKTKKAVDKKIGDMCKSRFSLIFKKYCEKRKEKEMKKEAVANDEHEKEIDSYYSGLKKLKKKFCTKPMSPQMKRICSKPKRPMA